MYKRFKNHNISAKVYEEIVLIRELINSYWEEGICLTIRQIFYKLASTNDNYNLNQKTYDHLCRVIGIGRMIGLLDFKSINDITRNLVHKQHFEDPKSIIDEVMKNMTSVDMWKNQKLRCELWLEKDASIRVVEDVCFEHDVPYLSGRGYISDSEAYNAAERFMGYIDDGYNVVVLQVGDFDPSGLDIYRSIKKKISELTFNSSVKFKRIGLTKGQIEKYNLMANPVKQSDPRSKAFIEKYGWNTWEIDALEPRVLKQLVSDEIDKIKNQSAWRKMLKMHEQNSKKLINIIKTWRTR